MLKNYLKITLRNLKRHKIYSFINITGLAIGFACFMLICLFIRYEFSYDRQHPNADRIYKAIFTFTEYYTMGTPKRAHSHPLLAPTLLNEFPEIETATRFSKYNNSMVRVQDQKFLFDKWVWADNRIFKVFDLPFIYGDPQTALEKPFSVVIDKDTALKLYGSINPVGKALHFIRGREETFQVTGVIENLPHNSHFKPKLLGSFETQESLGLSRALNSWDAHWFHSYFLLKEGCDIQELETKIQAYIKQKIHPLSNFQNWNYYLQPLTAIHLGSTDIINNLEANGDIKYVTILSIIAFFILFIAGVNYINLATARSFSRSQEISIRKVVGAHRSQLIKQFLGESMIITILALIAAVGSILFFLNTFANFMERDITIHSLSHSGFILSMSGAVILFGLLSGLYPALYLSGFKPIAILKGVHSTKSKGTNLRNYLVIFQFALSLFLIISTLVISGQLNFLRTKKLGFDREHVVVIKLTDSNINRQRNAVKAELLQSPGIKGATFTQTLPIYINWGSEFDFEGRGEGDFFQSYFCQVDYDYIDVFDMEITAGRNFLRKMTTDTEGGGAYILNETAAKQLGWENPIGKKIGFPDSDNIGTVIGVVKDFNSRSLHFPTEPVVLILNPSGGNIYFLSIKIESQNIPQTLAGIQKIWEKYSGGYPFEYDFLDTAYNHMYKSETDLSISFRFFTILAIFISCLGLFGLASFLAERRTKEIGIRKVLGASVLGITILFSKSMLKQVLLANLISWPLAYFTMHRWLQNFAYRINISVFTLVLSGALGFFIALFTVSYQTLKAAISNPVDSLRYE